MTEHRYVLLVDKDGKVGEFLQKTGDATDMVEVSVGQEDCRGLESLFREKVDDAISFLSGIDDPGFPVFAEDRAIDLESTDLYRQSFHRGKMVGDTGLGPVTPTV